MLNDLVLNKLGEFVKVHFFIHVGVGGVFDYGFNNSPRDNDLVEVRVVVDVKWGLGDRHELSSKTISTWIIVSYLIVSFINY
jgi:hypothetical protein